MPFPKSCIELARVIGQGIIYWGKPLYSLAMLVMITGESGLVYRGYVKRGQMNESVAIKTAKGLLVVETHMHDMFSQGRCKLWLW